jgi:hypothetical protein
MYGQFRPPGAGGFPGSGPPPPAYGGYGGGGYGGAAQQAGGGFGGQQHAANANAHADDKLSKVKDPLLTSIKWFKDRSPQEKTGLGVVGGIFMLLVLWRCGLLGQGGGQGVWSGPIGAAGALQGLGEPQIMATASGGAALSTAPLSRRSPRTCPQAAAGVVVVCACVPHCGVPPSTSTSTAQQLLAADQRSLPSAPSVRPSCLACVQDDRGP